MDTTPQTSNIGGEQNPGAYGVDAQYTNPIPSLEYNTGVVPQDTLPAEWWNWLWNSVTVQQLHTVADLTALFNEVNNLFQAAEIKPSDTDLAQIKQAVVTLADNNLKSYIDNTSIVKGQIQFNKESKLVVPIIGDTQQLKTTTKSTLTEAINELSDKVDSEVQTINQSITELTQTVNNNFSKIRTSAPDEPTAGDIWLEYQA